MNPKDLHKKKLTIRQVDKTDDGKLARKPSLMRMAAKPSALEHRKEIVAPDTTLLPPVMDKKKQPDILKTGGKVQAEVSPMAATTRSITATDINRCLPQSTDERSSEVDSPFGYNYADHETVNHNNGSLRYEFVDFTIPGVNGLDLAVKRVYNSSESAEREFTFAVNPTRAHYWYVFPTADPSNLLEVGGPYTNSFQGELNDHRAWAKDEWGGSPYISHDYKHMDSYFNYTTALRDNNQYLTEHKLGYGWRFGFPSIEAVPSGHTRASGINYRDYLHLGDGRRYAIVGNALEDYTLEDFTFAVSNGNFSFPDGTTEAYRYVVTFKDGLKYYLNRTNIVAMQDRFGNRICFRFEANGIRIWDTLNRLTRLEKINISSASTYDMRWVLPDGRTIQYSIRNNELYSAANFEGETTKYYYDVSPVSAQLFYYYSGDTAKTTNMHLLKAIGHPTGAATFYGWGGYREQASGIDDSGRFHDRKVLAYRYDTEVIEEWIEERNIFTYGYTLQVRAKPKQDKHREWQFEYYIKETVVTDAGRGTETVHTFNDKHLHTTEIKKLGSRALSSKSFEYNSDDLLIKETDVISGNSGSRTVQQQWSYDKKANLLTQTDALGFVTTMVYDTARFNLPTSKKYHIDPAKARLVEERFVLDSAGKTATEVQVYENNVLKQKTGMQYAANGNLAAKREYSTAGALLRTTAYTYQNNIFQSRATVDGLPQTLTEFDLLGAVTGETDPNGNVTRYERDLQGRTVVQYNPDGSFKQFFYFISDVENDNTVYIVDEEQNQSYVAYTPLGKLAQVTDLTGPAVLEGHYYDECNRPLYDYTADEELYIKAMTYHEYDYNDRPTGKRILDDAYDELMYQETYSYDDAVEGKYTKAVCTVLGDASARSITTVEYADALGRIVKSGAVIGGAECLDISAYDPLGNRLTLLTARDAARGMPYSGKWEYDFAGRAVKEYTPRATASTPEVYALTEYDAMGNAARTVDFRGGATRYTHDALGRVTRQETDFEGSTPAVTTFVYDNVGNITEQKALCNKPGEAEQWKRTKNNYDSRGRLTDTIVYTSATGTDYSHFEYDSRGNRTIVCTGIRGGNLNGAQITYYEYDHFNHVTKITDPMGRSEYYFYDGTGRLKNTQNKNGVGIGYGYDAMDRVLDEIAVDRTTMEMESKHKFYTLTGAVKSTQNQNLRVDYTYDETGHILTETESGGITKAFAYDYSGARTSMQLKRNGANLLNMAYTYDHAGRLQTVKRDGAVIAEYAYDANGNRQSLTYNGTGMVTSYVYNKANLITSLITRKNGTAVAEYSYSYYLDGNQAGKVEPGKTTAYTYDLAGRLLSESGGGQTFAYTYDRYGNRAMLTASGTEAYTVQYGYNLRNHLMQSYEVRGGVETLTDYEYDQVGNETARRQVGGVASTTLMRYNKFNQLVSVSKDGAETAYTYRPDGLRHSKTVSGTLTTHIWDGQNIVAELAANGTVKSRFLRGMNLIAQQIDSETQYYLFNAHGDVVQRASANGTILKRYDYDAFGVEKTPEALDQNPFRYCGEYFDKETETYYLRARHYNPRTGRFGAEDPAKSGLNWYTYCGNNPVIFHDPTGEVAVVDDIIIVAAAIIIIGAVVVATTPQDTASSSASSIPRIPSATEVIMVGTIYVSVKGSELVAEVEKAAAEISDGVVNAVDNIERAADDFLGQGNTAYAEKYKKPENKNRRKGADTRGRNPSAPGKNEAHGKPGEKENHSQKAKGSNGMPKGSYKGGPKR